MYEWSSAVVHFTYNLAHIWHIVHACTMFAPCFHLALWYLLSFLLESVLPTHLNKHTQNFCLCFTSIYASHDCTLLFAEFFT
mmetsp:Transcript_56660/g.101009  ORF Transcript_56660/g.101009 Transcript_56660/m.101009 type:complete len:82 (-) Transcript_56660:280-525(-)